MAVSQLQAHPLIKSSSKAHEGFSGFTDSKAWTAFLGGWVRKLVCLTSFLGEGFEFQGEVAFQV